VNSGLSARREQRFSGAEQIGDYLQGCFFLVFSSNQRDELQRKKECRLGKRKKEAKIRMVEKEKSEVVRMWGIIELVWPQARYTH
jgi:hypothetical protein